MRIPYLSHSRPQLYHHRSTQTKVIPLYPSMPWSWGVTEYSIHRVQHTVSTAYIVYSIHRVEHTPCTAPTHNCLSSHRSHDEVFTPECSFSIWCASLHDRPLSASSPWEHKGKVILSHCHGCELTSWWMGSQHPAHRPLTAVEYSSSLALSRLPISSPNSLDCGLQVHLETRLTPASEWICNLTRSPTPTVSAHSHHRGLQVYLQSRTIMASKCISKLAGSWPQSNLQTQSIMAGKFAWSWPPSESPNSLDYGLEVETVRASKCISKLARSQPWSVSLSSLNRHF